MAIFDCDSGENKPGQTDVQDTINSTPAGNTVRIPAGNYTWETTVTISGKALTLIGFGKNVTNITDQCGSGGAINIVCSAANFVNVSDLTLTQSIGHGSGMLQISGTQFQVAFRVHDIRTTQTLSAGSPRGIQTTNVFGLIDNNDIDVPNGASCQSISIIGGSITGSDGGFLSWQMPLDLGSQNAVYIEHNNFTRITVAGEDCIDAYAGARLVIRKNTFTNSHHGFHGTDSGFIRSPVSFEIYENTYINTTGVQATGAVIRGGTGVVYSNTYTGSWGGIALKLYRACENPNNSSWGTCDGTNWEVGSATISNQRSRLCTAIQGGTTGAMTNAAGYGLDQAVITLAPNVGSGTFVGGIAEPSGRIVGDVVFFGTSSKAHNITATSPSPAVVGGPGVVTITVSPAIGRNSLGAPDGETIPAVQTAITNGGVKYNTTNKETLGAEGGSFLGRWDGPLATFGYPCRDQPGIGPGQVVTPIYVWLNNGKDAGGIDAWAPFNCQGHTPEHYMLEGRDFINHPTNPKPGYSALAYPHPLIGGGGPDVTPPLTPTGVRVV